MGSSGNGILGAVITAVAVALAAWTGGASLAAAAAWGAAAGALSFVASSAMAQLGTTGYDDGHIIIPLYIASNGFTCIAWWRTTT